VVGGLPGPRCYGKASSLTFFFRGERSWWWVIESTTSLPHLLPPGGPVRLFILASLMFDKQSNERSERVNNIRAEWLFLPLSATAPTNSSPSGWWGGHFCAPPPMKGSFSPKEVPPRRKLFSPATAGSSKKERMSLLRWYRGDLLLYCLPRAENSFSPRLFFN